MTNSEPPKDDISTIARKCGRIIQAFSAGAMCQSEMLNQLDNLVPSGREVEMLVNLSPEDRSRLVNIYQGKHLTRDSYDGRYHVHLVICDSNIVEENAG